MRLCRDFHPFFALMSEFTAFSAVRAETTSVYVALWNFTGRQDFTGWCTCRVGRGKWGWGVLWRQSAAPPPGHEAV